MATLDLTSLREAGAALEAMIGEDRARRTAGDLTDMGRRMAESAVIQHFEFTYELCWKFMHRQLADEVSPEAVDVARRELFRLAARRGLIDDVEAWFAAQRARNATSHTYDQMIAGEVYRQALAFAPQAALLLARLTARQEP